MGMVLYHSSSLSTTLTKRKNIIMHFSWPFFYFYFCFLVIDVATLPTAPVRHFFISFHDVISSVCRYVPKSLVPIDVSSGQLPYGTWSSFVPIIRMGQSKVFTIWHRIPCLQMVEREVLWIFVWLWAFRT